MCQAGVVLCICCGAASERECLECAILVAFSLFTLVLGSMNNRQISPRDNVGVGRYIALLKDAFDPSGSGRGLFFSFDADITLTQQRYAAIAGDGPPTAKSLHARADSRFVWNKTHTQPLAGEWHRPVIAPLLRCRRSPNSLTRLVWRMGEISRLLMSFIALAAPI